MADRAVPDIFRVNSCECPMENCGLTVTEEDDINWCTGFWNELVRENPPRYSSFSCDMNYGNLQMLLREVMHIHFVCFFVFLIYYMRICSILH